MKPRSLSLVLLAFVAILSAVLIVPALGDSGDSTPDQARDSVAAVSTTSPTTTAPTTTSTAVAPVRVTSTTVAVATTTTTVVTSTTRPSPTTTTSPPAAATVKAPLVTTTTAPPVTPTTTAPEPTTTTTTEPQRVAAYDSSAESQLVSLVNNLRASVGVPALAHVGVLQSHARSWSQHMAETDTFAHSSLNDIPGPWQSVAENIAVSTSAQSAFDALVSSSGHHANMVNPTFTEIGSGVWADADGKLWITHVFRG